MAFDDVVGMAALWIAALASARAGLAPARASGWRPWLPLAAILAFLALDKPLNILDRVHEGLHHLGFGDPPLVHGIDDLLLLGLMALAAAIAAVCWREVLRDRLAFAVLAAGGFTFGVAFLIDSEGPLGGPVTTAEQWLEAAAALVMAAGFLLAARAPGPAGAGRERRAGSFAGS